MSEAHRAYRIKRVVEFLDVPADKRAECLANFALWLEVAQVSRDALGDMLKDVDFVWIDDGDTRLSGMSVRVVEE